MLSRQFTAGRPPVHKSARNGVTLKLMRSIHCVSYCTRILASQGSRSASAFELRSKLTRIIMAESPCPNKPGK